MAELGVVYGTRGERSGPCRAGDEHSPYYVVWWRLTFVAHAESHCGRSGASCNIGTLDVVERTSDGVVVYRRALQRVFHGIVGVSDIRHISHR